MKSTLNKSIAIIALFAALPPIRALAAATVHAAEPPTDAVVAASEPVAEVNATKANGTNIPLSEKATVRIDKSGIHIGGAHPVDINIPSLAHHRADNAMGIDVVGIVGVVFGCMVPIAIVGMVFYFRHRRLKMHHETMRAMIEKGMPVPPEMVAAARGDLLVGSGDVRPGRNDFRGGLILVAIGAGLLMIAGKVGWILVFIGAARLVVWLIDERNPKV